MKFMNLICVLCTTLFYTSLIYSEPNVWHHVQDQTQNLTKKSNDASAINPDSSSPYFFYKYDSEFQSQHVPLTLSDKEIAINFVRTPSIDIKKTLESENLFMFVPTDFKCWHLRPTLEQLGYPPDYVGPIELPENADSLYAAFYKCRANLSEPLTPHESQKYKISSSFTDEDFQAYLAIDNPWYIWRIHRRFNSNEEEVLAQIERLRTNPDIERVWAMFFSPNDTEFEPRTPNEFISVVFENDATDPQIQAFNAENNLDVVEIQNGIYKLKYFEGGGISSLQMAEKYRQNPLVVSARPEFYSWFAEGFYLPLSEIETFLRSNQYRIDFDKSGDLNIADFILFTSAFGSQKGETFYDSRFDLDGDGKVAFLDFVQFAQFFTN